MEIKITFRFDASEQFMTCIDRLKEAAENIVSSGMIKTLPGKDKGVTKAIVTADSVVVNKKERIYPPVVEEPKAESSTIEEMKKKQRLTAQDVMFLEDMLTEISKK